ncbi:MAG: IPT/TIG domain-containing protein, partial [Reinekea sp.]
INVRVSNTQAPSFFVGDDSVSATLVGSDAGVDEYQLTVEGTVPGLSKLSVQDITGARAERLGAIQFIKPLILNSVSPEQGTLNGGTLVTVNGEGFHADDQLQILFGQRPVTSYRVLDDQHIEVVAPAGLIGTADVSVTFSDGQSGTLNDAYRYIQPQQSAIETNTVIRDVALDPTNTYLFAAADSAGVLLLNVDASSYTSRDDRVFNPDDLLNIIDENGDRKDDRILVTASLPGGYRAMAVEPYFENGQDRVFVTGINNSGDAKLFILAFDPLDISSYHWVRQQTLQSDYGRGLQVENDQVLVATGATGLTVVDAWLQNKTYISTVLDMPGELPAQDVFAWYTKGEGMQYAAVVSGEYDLNSQQLLSRAQPDAGGFNIVELNAQSGYQVVATLDQPASKVVVDEQIAYLAAGEDGLVIVDVSNPKAPIMLRRFTEVGFVYDVTVQGGIAYVASGDKGIQLVDVSTPASPVILSANDTQNAFATVVTASDYASYAVGYGDVSVVGDSVLKVASIEPIDFVLQADYQGQYIARVRFNKVIEGLADNLDKFQWLDSDGNVLSTEVSIVGNDALVQLSDDALNSLSAGDILRLQVESGIGAPDDNDSAYVLYRLAATQIFKFQLSKTRITSTPELYDVTPRRALVGSTRTLQVSASGLEKATQLKLFLGGVELSPPTIQQDADNSDWSILSSQMPAISEPGLYSLVLEAEIGGLQYQAAISGAVAIDAPIRVDLVSPLWGPADRQARLDH